MTINCAQMFNIPAVSELWVTIPQLLACHGQIGRVSSVTSSILSGCSIPPGASSPSWSSHRALWSECAQGLYTHFRAAGEDFPMATGKGHRFGLGNWVVPREKEL